VKHKYALIALCVALAGGDALAQTTARDAQLMARAVGFANGLPRGAVDVAVVDGPGADELLAVMGGRISAGGVMLTLRRVPLGALAESGARVIIVPEGQGSAHGQIAQAARAMGALTISTDMSCVRANRCVVGVASAPRVEIVVSRAAARASGVSFARAFQVMIREV
jgi:hypothetical protein